jgi:hypothetical protein
VTGRNVPNGKQSGKKVRGNNQGGGGGRPNPPAGQVWPRGGRGK